MDVDKTSGRPLDFLHGYVSETKRLPEYLPLIDKNELRRLHIKNFHPIWVSSRPGVGSLNQATSYLDIPGGTKVSDLPPDLTAELKNAERSGKPICITRHLDGAWHVKSEEIDAFRAGLQSNYIQEGLVSEKRSRSMGIYDQEISAGWTERLLESARGTKMALATGAAVALGAVAYGGYRMSHKVNASAAEQHR